MKLNTQEIQELANLAKLNFSEIELQKMSLDFEKILSFINQLSTVNTENTSPLIHIHKSTFDIREDIVEQGDFKKSILERSPNNNGDYFKVPKVVKNK